MKTKWADRNETAKLRRRLWKCGWKVESGKRWISPTGEVYPTIHTAWAALQAHKEESVGMAALTKQVFDLLGEVAKLQLKWSARSEELKGVL